MASSERVKKQRETGSRFFPVEKVLQHIRLNHPRCPEYITKSIAERVHRKNWIGERLGKAVGIEMQNYIRHYMTDYDELWRRKIMTRDEARAYILTEVNEILRAWQPVAALDGEEGARDTAVNAGMPRPEAWARSQAGGDL